MPRLPQRYARRSVDMKRQALDRARRARDARFDGHFFVAVTTTRIYCRPICPAPSPNDGNVCYFSTAAEAQTAGFRPCLRCRPEASPGTPAWHGTRALVSRAVRLIAEGALNEHGVEHLADRLGITSRHLRRLFLHHLGTTPLRIARGRYECRLPYRPPYDWDAALSFLKARATPGVEDVSDTGYRRTIALGGTVGMIEVSQQSAEARLMLTARLPDPGPLLEVVERTRRIFDINANAEAIAADLDNDPLLRRPLHAHPGLRVIGAWDGFEIAVRAVLGQQISVRAATTLAGRLASTFGTCVNVNERLDRIFPLPAQLANAPIETVGVMPARAETIRQLARRVAEGTIVFGDCASAAATAQALRSVPGIGDWTAHYVSMRAFGDPDAFLGGDLILRRAAAAVSARALERRAEIWRPWRAYAVMLLWQGANDVVDTSRDGQPRRRTDRSVVACGPR